MKKRNKQAQVTWTARDLKSEEVDPDDIVSISDNQFTPIAGTYTLTTRIDSKTGKTVIALEKTG